MVLTCDLGKFYDLSEFYFHADVSKKLIFLCRKGVQYVMYDLKSDQKLRPSIQCYFCGAILRKSVNFLPTLGLKNSQCNVCGCRLCAFHHVGCPAMCMYVQLVRCLLHFIADTLSQYERLILH